MVASTITLNNGKQIPALGLGTAGRGILVENISYAISVGYRHFDTAAGYGTEPQVGEGIRNAISKGIVKREDVFVTTKLSNKIHGKDKAIEACKESVKNLGLDYIDLYLIHWPVSFGPKPDGSDGVELIKYDLVDTWRGLEECVGLGLVKSIGFSNFNEEEILTIVNAAKIKPVMNQIEVNIFRNQKKLRAFCKKHQIEVTAYSPLTAPYKPSGADVVNFEDPKLAEIGKTYGKTVSQVLLRYLLDEGVIPVPKSTNEDRMKLNLDVFDFKLSPQEIKIIDGFNQGEGIRYPTRLRKPQ